MSAESNIKVGDRVWVNYPSCHDHGREGLAGDYQEFLGSGPGYWVVLDGEAAAYWFREIRLERLPDPARAESDLMARLEEGVEPPRSKPRPDPTIEGTVAGAAAWAQQDPDLRRVTVAVHKGVVDIHANLSPFSAARRLRLCIPFCADAVSCFLDGMMMEPDRGLCVTVNRSAEVA